MRSSNLVHFANELLTIWLRSRCLSSLLVCMHASLDACAV